ncbi:hypothetical protein ACBR40_36435, partial [Nonomuraea sp. AD125B]
VEASGFTARVENNTVTTDGLRCGKISAQSPKGGTMLEVGKVVKMVVIDGGCESPSPTASPTTSK